MALSRFVVTAPVTLPQGTVIATLTAGKPGTGGAAGFGNVGISASYGAFPQTIVPGQAIVLDSAGTLYAYLNGQGVLRAYVQGQDDAGHAALAN